MEYAKIVELIMRKSQEVFQEDLKEPKEFINALFDSVEFQMIFEELLKTKTEIQKQIFLNYLETIKSVMINVLEKQWKS